MTGSRPSLLFKAMKKRTLSIFVDESGILNESRKDIPVRFAQAVEPRKYKLFQLADLACTIKLLELKLKTEGRLAPCERRFFGGEKKFIHDILRRMKAKEI